MMTLTQLLNQLVNDTIDKDYLLPGFKAGHGKIYSMQIDS